MSETSSLLAMPASSTAFLISDQVICFTSSETDHCFIDSQGLYLRVPFVSGCSPKLDFDGPARSSRSGLHKSQASSLPDDFLKSSAGGSCGRLWKGFVGALYRFPCGPILPIR